MTAVKYTLESVRKPVCVFKSHLSSRHGSMPQHRVADNSTHLCGYPKDTEDDTSLVYLGQIGV